MYLNSIHIHMYTNSKVYIYIYTYRYPINNQPFNHAIFWIPHFVWNKVLALQPATWELYQGQAPVGWC